MARSLRETEKENIKRLAREFSRLNEREHRSAFHRHLENTYLRNVDKPATYDELKRAYLSWR